MARSNNGSSTAWLSQGNAVVSAAPLGMLGRVLLNNGSNFFNLFGLANNDASQYHFIAASGGGSPSFRLFTQDGGGEVGAICGATYSTGTWYLIAALVLSATERYITMDAANEGSNTSSRTPTVSRTFVGALRNESGSATFGAVDGKVCDVAFYDVTDWGADASARKGAWDRFVTGVKNGRSAGAAYVGQAAYWRLDGYDSPEPDLKRSGGTRFPLTVNGTMPLASNGPFSVYSQRWWPASAPAAPAAGTTPTPYYYRHLAGGTA